MDRWKGILITGASSGIGRALALGCARPATTLHLGGRDAARLATTAQACRERGAVVHVMAADVRDSEGTGAWIGGAGRLDLVIANAGISAGTGDAQAETAAQVRSIIATNLVGVLNTVLPAMAVMDTQGPAADGFRGQIAVIASIAAFIAHPGAPTYCASKAAVDRWVVATAPIARARGIALTSVCPGFVVSPMTAGNRFPMPGLMSAERAAGIILRGIATRRVRVVFPWWLALLARTLDLLPARLSGALLAGAPGKDAISSASEGTEP